MGTLFGILGELLVLTGGIVCILVFGKLYKPNYKNEASKTRLEGLINKRGPLLVGLGVILVLLSLFNLTRILI